MTEPWRSSHIPRYLRGYLVSHGLNAIFFMLTFGSSVFVLFLADLGLSEDRIGLVLSLFPFCGLIAPLISSWVTRFGLRRTYLVFYGVRKFVVLLMLAVPWVLHRFGPGPLFLYVVAVNLALALCRATAETAYYPWSREFIPDAIRGRVGGMQNVVISLTSAVAMLGASLVLGRGDGYGRYQILIGVASFAGILSVLAMTPVPRESTSPAVSMRESRRAMLRVLRDRRFGGFLLGVMMSILSAAAYPFLALYAREQLLIPEARVVLFDVAGTLGALLSSMYWGWASDRYGGKPVTLSTMGFVGLLPWLWLLLPQGSDLALVGGLFLAFIYGVVSIGLNIGSFRWFLNSVVPMQGRTAYTSIWYAGAGLAGGLAPFLAGTLLRGAAGFEGPLGLGAGAFPLLFLATSLLAGLSVLFYSLVPAETDVRVLDYVRTSLARDIPASFGRVVGMLRIRRPLRVRR